MLLVEITLCYFLGFLALILTTFLFRVSDRLFARLIFSSLAAFLVFLIAATVGFKPLPLLPFNATLIGYFGLLGCAVITLINLIA